MFWGKLKEITRVIREIHTDEIAVPDGRVRQVGYDDALRGLANSIKEHGVLEPLLVRRLGDGFSLIAGERRLRAAEIAGLETVPCVAIEASEVEAAVIAIIENLHREDLNMFEEACAIASLISMSGMTQEVCARRLSVSQSYVANKLRLMRFTGTEREYILENGLTERHARALLRLPTTEERTETAHVFVERGMNVASAEEYVESMLCAAARSEELKTKPAGSEGRKKLIIRDIRIFYNSIDHAVDVMKKSGIAVESKREETENGVLISILVPR